MGMILKFSTIFKHISFHLFIHLITYIVSIFYNTIQNKRHRSLTVERVIKVNLIQLSWIWFALSTVEPLVLKLVSMISGLPPSSGLVSSLPLGDAWGAQFVSEASQARRRRGRVHCIHTVLRRRRPRPGLWGLDRNCWFQNLPRDR